jgi:hypothetical protein
MITPIADSTVNQFQKSTDVVFRKHFVNLCVMYYYAPIVCIRTSLLHLVHIQLAGWLLVSLSRSSLYRDI